MTHLRLFLALFLVASRLPAAGLTITTAFPGGNAQVEKIEGDTAYVGPDLRGGKAWFYWYFEAQASEPGRATFVFARSGFLGVRGPAVSRDGGLTWQWMGADRILPRASQEAFEYEFTQANERVRFSVGIPYVQANLDAFLVRHATSPYLSCSVLTQSREGRPVELLQIGKPGPDKRTLLLTARHHACEALASYVLEGFLQEALSESAAARSFRENYALLVIPFVDKDGVEDGDQGKNRTPHDHNRDYGEAPLFPEVKAIQELGEKYAVQIALDLHCPALKGDIHEAFHFLGLGVPHVKENLDELIQWIGEERPPIAMSPLDFLADPAKPNPAISSHHFALRAGSLLAATLETPYTQPKVALDADLARAYGASLLKAINHTEFLPAAPATTRGSAGHGEWSAWRTEFLQVYRKQPAEAEASVKSYLDDPNAAPLYRDEARDLMALLRFEQHRYGEARALAEAVLQDGSAMTSQIATAHGLRIRALAADPQTAPADFAKAFAEAAQFPYPSNAQRAALLAAAVDFYQGRQDFEKAIVTGRQLVSVMPEYEKGKTLNRIATFHDALQQPEKALATRRECIALLRRQLSPVPQRSVFGATMAVELFDTVMALPASTLEEKQAAAELVLRHDVVAAAVKDRVRKGLSQASSR